MSRLAKSVLAASVTVTCSIIYYVHYSQNRDKQRMKEGIVIDMARQERKRQNVHQLELQTDLTKILQRQREEQDRKELVQALSKKGETS